MAVEKMSLVTVSGDLEDLDAFICRCCLGGNLQPEPAIAHISDSMGFVPLVEENQYADALANIQELADSFGVTLKLVEGFDFTQGDEALDRMYLQELGEKFQSLLAEQKEVQAKIEECRGQQESLSHFMEMDIPVNEILECEFIKFRFGRLPKQSMSKLSLLEENPYLIFFPCSYDEENAWGVYFAPLDKAEEIDTVFASLFFERMRIPETYATPDKAIAACKARAEKHRRRLEEIDAEIRHIWETEQEKCNLLYTRLVYGNCLHELRGNVAVYHNSFCLVGWVADGELKEVLGNIEQSDRVDWEVEPAEELAGHFQPPVRLKNNRFSRPYEEFVEMYGIPQYHELDPTGFLAVVYTLLFGIMFADLGQGVVLALVGWFLWRRSRSRLGGILLRCGVASACFGTLFGSVFGFEELLDPFYQTVFGLSGKPFDVMEEINTVLLFAIGIGVFLVLLAMGIHVADSVKRKLWGEALFSQNGIVGMVTYCGGVLFVLKFMTGESGLMDVMPYTVPLVMIGLGLALLFFKEILIGKADRHKHYLPENWGDYCLTNLFELLEYVLSYFSNTVSFLRVGAFVLVHAGMMMVVFSLAPDSGPMRYLVIVLGNLLVMGLEGILTYIQVLRLGFYEMFSRFYEGGGKPFQALRLTRPVKE
ncbi:MAG: ATPase [Clostridiales bacterium]|nr:ATPase [Clostridiales bacterium]